MSPYIVTVKRETRGAECKPGPSDGDGYSRGTVVLTSVLSRRAVATLDEAQAYVSGFVSARTTSADNRGARQGAANQLWNLPESGGTVGPLPDGTQIEVGRTAWETLSDDSRLPREIGPRRHAIVHAADSGDERAQRLIIAAYNEGAGVTRGNR